MTDRDRIIIDDLLMRKVDEVSYLVAENAALYRPIVRFFLQRYDQSETGWLWPIEVAEFVRRHHPHHPAYSDEACEGHLRQLESWGVLVSEHDVNQARTIEEFVRAARRYQITESARLIEEMLVRLSGQDGSRGSLDITRLNRLREALFELDRLLSSSSEQPGHDLLRAIESAWNLADDARTEIREDANRYLRELDHERMPSAANLVVFLQYKRMLRDYLDEFALGLKDFAERTRDLFDDWAESGKDRRLVALLTRNERERKGDLRDDLEIGAGFEGQIRVLRGFSAAGGDADILHAKTTARVRGLVEQIERAVTERRHAQNRKRDLELLAKAFRRLRTDEDAHELAATAFGWGTPRHTRAFNADAAAELDPQVSVWLQSPWSVELRARVGGNPTFRAVSTLRDRSLQRLELITEAKKRKQDEIDFWNLLFRNGTLELDGLELQDPEDRPRIVRLLRDCLRNPDGSVRLPDGSRVTVLLPPSPEAIAEVRAPDGTLYVRAFQLQRTEVEP